MLSLLITIVVTLLIVGLFLWAVDAMPFINAGVKKMISILIIVFAVLWVIQMIFPAVRSAL